MKIMRKRRSESGQTLIAGVIVLIIILLITILLFDVQNIIRGKVKAQNAVDAAALTGANWQMHTMNLIGELNLVKASTLMFSDATLGIAVPPESFTLINRPVEGQEGQEGQVETIPLTEQIKRVEADKKKMKTAIDLLTQMQTRISFVGPLIGVGAAQQAAKNNGISANIGSGDLIYEAMYKKILDPEFYGNPDIAQQIINDYEWRLPYAAMIYKILERKNDKAYGLAACPRFDFVGVPRVVSNTSNPFFQFLVSSDFYAAVLGNDWCALIHFLDQPLISNWWTGFECSYKTRFIEESEILPIHLKFITGATPYDQAEKANVWNLIFTKRSQLRPIGSAFDREDPYSYTYNPETDTVINIGSHNTADTDNRYNPLPYITWAVFDTERWQKYPGDVISSWRQYLHGRFKPGLDYYCGEPAYFEIAQDTSTMIGRMNIGESTKDIGSTKSKLGRSFKNNSEIARNAGRNLKTLSNSLRANASAKVIGRIMFSDGTALAPFEAGSIILPVFTHTALLPVSLEPPSGFPCLNVSWYYYITEFIPILGQSSSLDEAWEQAAQKYPDHVGHFSRYYQALKKINDPTWIQAGKTWLDTPVTYYTDEEGERHVLQRNRDFCNYWPSGGSGGGRRGPGILH